jgi:beta-glucosidase
MHELYLWPFADAVRANVASVMCSYNKLNGTWACENDKVLNGLLKHELDFKGYVMRYQNFLFIASYVVRLIVLQ